MIKIYFVCMGNYYRSRLAEELAIYYASLCDLELQVDSGGLSNVEESLNPGPIAKAVLRYMEEKNITPLGAVRNPKRCEAEVVYSSDIVVCTDADEQLHLFKQAFPDYAGRIIGWRARDQHDDPWLQTPNLIDKHVQALIKELRDAR
jgi:protein-tyrosine phosphatase